MVWQANAAEALMLRDEVQQCSLQSKGEVIAEAVCPPDAAQLLCLPDVFEASLGLAKRLLIARYPGLSWTHEELMDELVLRYLDARRKYRWPKWLHDREEAEWTSFVYFSMAGRPEFGPMQSIAQAESERAKRHAEESVEPQDPDGATDALTDLLDFLTQELAAGDARDTDGACKLVANQCRELLRCAIEQCARAGAFEGPDHDHGHIAWDVYTALYIELPARRQEDIGRALADKGCTLTFVKNMANDKWLIPKLELHAKALVGEISDTIDRALEVQRVGFRVQPEAAPVLHRSPPTKRSGDSQSKDPNAGDPP